jgi:hypothetical protein
MRQTESTLTAISKVYLFSNDMLMVFDGRGEQMGDYQGTYAERSEAILRDAPPHTIFYYAMIFGPWIDLKMTREQFERKELPRAIRPQGRAGGDPRRA